MRANVEEVWPLGGPGAGRLSHPPGPLLPPLTNVREALESPYGRY